KDARDGVSVYYRSRPLMLALGAGLEDVAAGPLARAGSCSNGRDIGVVFNLPAKGGPTVLPACGGLGAQNTPAAGWAQAIRYRSEVLRDASYDRSIAVVLGGDQWVLVLPHHRHHVVLADALLYRGQRLRHLGAG
ncbi:MAG TPA: hypothetical protein VN750_24065, partial [Steroidobacteraceae bacterium]|nr:hypothetical protein [Steroidobacteraceae bacterium]